jgi:hypothetical protein
MVSIELGERMTTGVGMYARPGHDASGTIVAGNRYDLPAQIHAAAGAATRGLFS